MKHGFRPKRSVPAEETKRFYKQFAASKLEDCHSMLVEGTMLVSKWLWDQLREKEPSFSIDVPKNDLVYARVLGHRVIVSDRLPYKTRFPSKRQQRRATLRRHGKVKPSSFDEPGDYFGPRSELYKHERFNYPPPNKYEFGSFVTDMRFGAKVHF